LLQPVFFVLPLLPRGVDARARLVVVRALRREVLVALAQHALAVLAPLVRHLLAVRQDRRWVRC
jgi:hypothetical protein